MDRRRVELIVDRMLKDGAPVSVWEDIASYRHMLAQFVADLRPWRPIQQAIVEQMANYAWRAKRGNRLSAAAFEAIRAEAKRLAKQHEDIQIAIRGEPRTTPGDRIAENLHSKAESLVEDTQANLKQGESEFGDPACFHKNIV